jgi:hypothetical protein
MNKRGAVLPANAVEKSVDNVQNSRKQNIYSLRGIIPAAPFYSSARE